MPDSWKKALRDTPERKKSHYVRDFFLVLLGLLMVFIFFQSQSRFDFDPRGYKGAKHDPRKIVYSGPLKPENLNLGPKELRPLEKLLASEDRNYTQVRIHIEAQDSYGAMDSQTQLRFWCSMTMGDGRTVRSVIMRSTRKDLVQNLTKRLRRDLDEYRETLRNTGKKNVESFTNTM
ncbi:MAG: hypothetical protein V3573_04460 [Desulfovibrionaceae bacterium]